MRMNLREIAAIAGGHLVGDGELEITGVSVIEHARDGEITFVAEKKFLKAALESPASALLVRENLECPSSLPRVLVENPHIAYARLLNAFYPEERPATGVSPHAAVHPSVRLGNNCAVMAHAHIEAESVIGDDVVIYPSVFIGERVAIGSGTTIRPNVTIYGCTKIGAKVTIHAGAVIGSDGFGFERGANGGYYKVRQLGIVEIGDDVEIGANACIDRAKSRRGKTLIGSGTKIDNLVHIAHNVRVGPNSVILAQAGIAGSCTVGEGAQLGGQVGITPGVVIGDGATLAPQSGVLRNVPSGAVVSGSPAIRHQRQLRVQGVLPKLPNIRRSLRKLERKVALLKDEAQVSHHGKQRSDGDEAKK